MTKTTLKTITPVGTFTRKTATKYTHVVVWNSPRAAKVFAEFDGKHCGMAVDARWVKDGGFGVTWHSSERAALAATKGYKWDRAVTLVGVFAVEAEEVDLAAWEPVADPEAWKREDDARIAAHRAKQRA